MQNNNNNDRFQSLTKELYSKNVDLLNANNVLELIQELYDIMISCYSTQSISHRFINTITEKMGFSDGIVLTKEKEGPCLKVSGVTQTELNRTIMDLSGQATVNFCFNKSHQDNFLVKAYLSGNSTTSSNIADVWTPYVKPDDVQGISSILGGSVSILIFPITYGQKIMGSFALLGKKKDDLTIFEKKALEKVVSVFGIAMDRVILNEKLQAAHKSEIDKANEIIRLKDEFVFIATHDLRTPVNAILGFAELLKPKMQTLDKDTQEDMAAIVDSASRLNQLVEDLLEVARSESRSIKVEANPVFVKEIIDKSVSQLTPVADKRGIKINLDLAKEDTKVLGDAAKISEILENLLSNAVKYNRDDGSVMVRTWVEGDFVKFEISDTGIGIPKDKQDKVFSKFFRAKQTGTENIPGTGLGLFVVRMLIEKMNGKVHFESEEGKGTKFIFQLPLFK